MGLDQYAYIAQRQNQYHDFWSNVRYDQENQNYVSSIGIECPRELMVWRKHSTLQVWMFNLWAKRNHLESHYIIDFNGVELELFWDDIDQLEKDILSGRLAKLYTHHIRGYWVAQHSGDKYRERDLEFCHNAKSELFFKYRLFYNSSW